MSIDLPQDKWLDLIERFTARGARVTIGNMQRDFVTHLLNVVEEQDVRIAALEAKVAKLRADLGG